MLQHQVVLQKNQIWLEPSFRKGIVKIGNNKHNVIFQKEIQGSIGTVKMYKSDNINFCIKFYLSPEKFEKENILFDKIEGMGLEYIFCKRYNYHLGTTYVHSLPHTLVLEQADCDLFDFTHNELMKSNVSLKTVLSIYRSVIDKLIRLKNNGLYFIDVKTENILIKKHKTNSVEIKFCDISSLYKKGVSNDMTFVPPNINCTIGDNVTSQELENLIIWQCGVLLLQMLGGNVLEVVPFFIRENHNLACNLNYFYRKKDFGKLNVYYNELLEIINLFLCQTKMNTTYSENPVINYCFNPQYYFSSGYKHSLENLRQLVIEQINLL